MKKFSIRILAASLSVAAVVAASVGLSASGLTAELTGLGGNKAWWVIHTNNNVNWLESVPYDYTGILSCSWNKTLVDEASLQVKHGAYATQAYVLCGTNDKYSNIAGTSVYTKRIDVGSKKNTKAYYYASFPYVKY